MNIVEPNAIFMEKMLDPAYWKFGNDTNIVDVVIMSTDEWINMQNCALRLLTGEAGGLAEEMVKFWENVVFGVVPNGLRITKPDSMTNIR